MELLMGAVDLEYPGPGRCGQRLQAAQQCAHAGQNQNWPHCQVSALPFCYFSVLFHYLEYLRFVGFIRNVALSEQCFLVFCFKMYKKPA
jgi:hypothetical protein